MDNPNTFNSMPTYGQIESGLLKKNVAISRVKTHYATCDRANESDNHDYWGNTLCGLEYTESPMSDRIEHVTCKKCLKRYEKQKDCDKRAMINVL